MANTQKARSVAKKSTKGTVKFAALRREAEAKIAERPERKEVPPFVIEDVEPPIEITAPDTVERQMIIGELISREGNFELQAALPLLRALCGPAFPRIWMLVRDDKEPDTLVLLIQAIFKHFEAVLSDAVEAEELPGGSEGLSD